MRFVALELLADDPQDEFLARSWGDLLPLWLPFGFWTGLLATDISATTSLETCVEKWLVLCGADDLIPPVQGALADKRLLLLVDGLDEWANEDAGRLALQLLQVFIERHGVAAIVTTRPEAASRLGFHGGDWKQSRIAPLSVTQQRAIALVWYRILHRVDDVDGAARTSGDADRFVHELSRSSQLRELATFPLTLCLLLLVRFQDNALPQGRFEAYDRVVDLLVATHPARRRAAAQSVTSREALNPREMRRCLAALAYAAQAEGMAGVVSEERARETLGRYIRDANGLGRSESDSLDLTDTLLSLAEDSRGILLRLGTREFSFLHRSVGEYLAACHLLTFDLAEQAAVVRANCTDSRWREVIIAACVLSARREDVAALIGAMHLRLDIGLTCVEAMDVQAVLGEVAFADTQLSADVSQTLAKDILDSIEQHPYAPFRAALLRVALDGMQTARVRPLVRSRLRGWLFERAHWRGAWINSVGRWPADEDTLAVLLRGMRDPNGEVQRASASTLAILFGGDGVISEKVVLLSSGHPHPSTRAVALEALMLGWPDHPALDTLIEQARRSDALELRLMGVLAGTKRGQVDESDYGLLLRVTTTAYQVPHAWKDLPIDALVEGWTNSPQLRRTCLTAATQRGTHGPRMDPSAVQALLLRAFPQDSEVATWCVSQLETEEHPFLMLNLEGWRTLARNFDRDATVVSAFERWAQRQEFRDPELAMASTLSTSGVVKAVLLTHLTTSSVPHWSAYALLENWGMEDKEAGSALRAFVGMSEANASRIGYLVPRILDSQEAWSCLRRALESDACTRPDFVMQGLGGLKGPADEIQAVVRVGMEMATQPRGYPWHEVRDRLIEAFPNNPQVKAMALAELRATRSSAGAVIWSYGEDADMRMEAAQYLLPLPANMRSMLVSYLSDNESNDDVAIELLQDYRTETDASIKAQASIGYYTRLVQAGQLTDDHIARLRLDIVATGLDLDEQRQAALAGLLVLDRVDVFRDAVEHTGSPSRVGLATVWSPNLPLATRLAESWDQVKEVVGVSVTDRLTGHFGGTSFWTTMCHVAEGFPGLLSEVRDAIAQDTTLRVDPAALGLVALTEGDTVGLLDLCLEALEANGGHTLGDSDRLRETARLTASHFSGQDRAREALAGPGLSLSDTGRLVALCYGWPRDSELKRLHQELLEGDGTQWVHPTAVRALRYVCSAADTLRSLVEHDLLLAREGLLWHVGQASDLLIGRLRSDQALAEAAISWLTSTPNPAMRLALGRGLVAAGVARDELTSWISREIERQLDSAAPDLAFDLVAGFARPVGYAFLEDGFSGGSSMGGQT